MHWSVFEDLLGGVIVATAQERSRRVEGRVAVIGDALASRAGCWPHSGGFH